jgi:hypothetical protein
MSLMKVAAGRDLPRDINVIIEISSHSEPIKYEVEWYRHRANRDITLLSQRLTSLLEERKNATVPQLELPLNISVTLAFSSESEASVTDHSLSTEAKTANFSI